MKEYEINEDTLAVIPIDEKSTKIIEENREYVVEKNTYKIMDDSCQYFGSTYEGRKGGSKNILGTGYKVPILVKEENYVILFPSESPSLSSCIWLSLHHIQEVKQAEDNHAIVYFKNNQKLDLLVSYRSIENQILRSSRLESILRARSQEKSAKI